MAFQKRHKEPYLTASDRERLARMSDNPFAKLRKFKSLLTLECKGIKQEICIYIYGKSEEDIKEKAKEHGGEIVSLGKRILRTETAAIASLSICMFNIEANL